VKLTSAEKKYPAAVLIFIRLEDVKGNIVSWF
jgi:hypothetical protein